MNCWIQTLKYIIHDKHELDYITYFDILTFLFLCYREKSIQTIISVAYTKYFMFSASYIE